MSTQPSSASNTTTTPNPSQAQKRPHPSKPPQTLTLRNPPWTYIHLQHLTPSATTTVNTNTNPSALDALTAHLHLTTALTQYLGTHGAAVPIDVLNLKGSEVWIRVPAGDFRGVVAAAGGWVGRNGEGWRVRGWSSWGIGGGREGGREVFEN